MSDRLAHLLATVAGLGDRLPAPGTTVGSVTGAVVLGLLLRAFPAHPLAVVLVGLAVLLPVSVWACGAEANRRGEEDPGPVVLDEVAGQWVALGMVALIRPGLATLPMIAASFVLFRIADIVKPWPIRRLERLPGGWGIVADDLAAGLLAGVVEVVLLKLL